MRNSLKYVLISGVVFLILFTFVKIPQQTAKIIFQVKKMFKQVILKDTSPRYDAITSASIRFDNKNSFFSEKKS